MHVILDTSVIFDNYRFDTPKFTGLFGYLKKTRCKLYIPESVMKETFNKYRQGLEKYAEREEKDSKIFLGKPSSIDVASVENDYHKHYLKLVRDKKIAHFKAKRYSVADLFDKALKSRAPFDAAGRGFRDAVIWADVLDLINSNPKDHFCFISANTKDFGVAQFHPSLIEELGKSSNRLFYFNSIESFLSEYGESITFIDKSFLEAFLDQNRDYLSSLLDLSSIPKSGLYGVDRSDISDLEDVELKSFEVLDYYIYESTKDKYKVQVEVMMELDVNVSIYESIDSWETRVETVQSACWVDLPIFIDRKTQIPEIPSEAAPNLAYAS